MRPNRLPTPIQIMDEPERAILAALDITLEIVENAVLAAHPELYAEEQPSGACEESLAADRLLGLIREMQGTIAAYQRWLKEAPKPPADPPF
jgi:hypothetical protein